MSIITEPVLTDRTGRDIANAISSFAAGFWSEKEKHLEPKDVNFYDYDGVITNAYTAAEFLALDAMPANPSHEGLIAQGWNWSFEEAQRYVAAYGSCEIGQSYTTTDGKTRLYIEVAETERMSITVQWAQTVANGVVLDWGDGSETETGEGTGTTLVKLSHTYAQPGAYVVTLDVAEDCTMILGGNTTNNGTNEAATGHFYGFVCSQYLGGRYPARRLEIGDRVTAIGNSAMIWNTLLQTVTIPTSVTAIYQYAFLSNRNLLAVVVPHGCTLVGPYAFRTCQSAVAICLPEGLTSLGMGAMGGCVSLHRVSIPEGVTSMSQLFRHDYELSRVVVPDSVTSVGAYCFESCYSLRHVHYPAGATSVPNYCFHGCHTLTGLELPEGVTSIGTMAFASCFALGTLTIPSTVTSIGTLALLYGDGYEALHVKATTPPTMTDGTAGWPFSGVAIDAVIYVPYSADHSVLNAYLSATGWATLGDQLQEEAEA